VHKVGFHYTEVSRYRVNKTQNSTISFMFFAVGFLMPIFVIAKRCHVSKIQNSRFLPAPYTHMSI